MTGGGYDTASHAGKHVTVNHTVDTADGTKGDAYGNNAIGPGAGLSSKQPYGNSAPAISTEHPDGVQSRDTESNSGANQLGRNRPADDWRMLHPAGLIVATVSSVRGIIGLFVTFLVILRRHLSVPMIALALATAIVAALIPPVIEWLTTRYRLGSDGLSFKSGLFFRKHRTISYGSIHAINSSSPVYLQPFGVVRLTVSAAGSADTDIRLDAVPAVLQLELETFRAQARTGQAANVGSTQVPHDARQAVNTTFDAAVNDTSDGFAKTPGIPEANVRTIAVPPKRDTRYDPAYTAGPIACVGKPAIPADSRGQAPVFRASVKDILLFAVTDIGFLAAAFVVYGFVQQVQEIVPESWVRDAERSVSAVATSNLLSIALAVLVCVMVLMLVSIVTSLLRFYGFEVWRRGDDLVVVRGLFTRRTSTIPVSRIQTVIVKQSLLRRPFGLCSVGLGLSSSATGENAEGSISAARILPVIGTRRVYDVLHAMLPEWDVREPVVQAEVHSPIARAAATGTSAGLGSGVNASQAAQPLEPEPAAGPVIRYTGRGLLRYYLTMPVMMTLAATTLTWLGSDADAATAFRTAFAIPGLGWWPWWLLFVPVAIGLWWTAVRWLKSREEGYALVPDAAYGNNDDTYGGNSGSAASNGTDNRTVQGPASHDHGTHVLSCGFGTDGQMVTPHHRIVATGAVRLARYTTITTRSRVQSITRSTMLWREPRGIERVQMSLFVMNGIDSLRFMFLRRADAEALEQWMEG
ncbi:PH domain-containing protein [Bifidobacterium callitrichidarum]|uniref:YdbS-like PH domain-containing protein n=1 Tax=Bifidobacterium callitrichidarum TaxID=2052941 RepID=A0A2U2NAG7_9BIFI|nr:PH domain-containing protein [Bifidobacterium callitrichidarum]PWG66156.1 hypothetical protein DF196_04915 [Bifidobacterium callitrichidarum]